MYLHIIPISFNVVITIQIHTENDNTLIRTFVNLVLKQNTKELMHRYCGTNNGA